jgi:hypothetical protein
VHARTIVFKIIIFLLPLVGLSQSDHYWSQNFNLGSSLLSGAVVGGKAGVSAVYYNPAQIGHDSTMNLSFSVNLISFQSYKIQNFAGDNIDLSKFNFKLQPKYISYIFQPAKTDKIYIELAVLSRASESLTFNVDQNNKLDIIKRLDGDEHYTGNLKSSRKYDDKWVGGGASYRFNNNWSIGASLFFSVKVMDYSYGHSMYAFQPSDTLFSGGNPEQYYFPLFELEERLKYWDISLIPKLGIHYLSDNQTFGFGLNFTFPNLGIYGQGDVGKKITRANIYNENEGTFTNDIVLLEKQRKARTNIEDPFSAAIGFLFSSRNERSVVLITAEYFNRVDPYPIISTSDVLTNSNDSAKELFGDQDIMSFYYNADPVTNVAIGFRQYFNEKISVLGGFRTDFSSYSEISDEFENNKPKLFKIHQDKFHFTGGPYLSWKKINLFLGLQYSFGRADDLEQIINFSDPVEYNSQSGESLQGIRKNNMSINYNELSLFFGFTYKTSGKK